MKKWQVEIPILVLLVYFSLVLFCGYMLGKSKGWGECKDLVVETLNEYSAIPYIDNLIGIHTDNPDTLAEHIESLGEPAYPFVISLVAEDMPEGRIPFIIKSRADIPKYSVKSQCPKSNKYKIKECWFIKYKEES